MWPATAWDDLDWDGTSARGWTVMGRVRERQRQSVYHRGAAEARLRSNASFMRLMTPAVIQQDYEDRLMAGWRGNFSVLAFLFALPDEPSFRTLDLRGDYYNVRTGDTWDLFFPGYYHSDTVAMERAVGAKPVGEKFTADWYFNPQDFNMLREHIEHSTNGAWSFSGGADLVLINAYVPDHGVPVVDWSSVQSGSVAPTGAESLSAAIEKISRDLEDATEDPSYGVASLVNPPVPSKADSAAKKVMIGALGGVLAALGTSHLGL